MPNDLTTLSGALLEMKDELIYQLGQKGVTATYSSTDGLLGLIGRISDIQTGGGSCYKVDFNNASYTTSGTATVSVTVLKNYSACVGETVTFTSSTSTTTTATTNSNGVATATISFSGSTTLTATIGGASDTATIVISSYLFYDTCSSATGLSNYGSSVAVRGSGSSMTMSYDSTENAYKCSGSGNWYSIIPISVLNDEDEYVIEADFKIQNISENGIGLCIDNRNDSTSNSYACWIEGGSGKYIGKQFNLNTDGTVNQHYGLNLSSSKWYRIEMIINGTSLTGNLYDGDTLISTDSTTLTVNNSQMGIFLMTQNGTTNSACWVKNIKAELL